MRAELPSGEDSGMGGVERVEGVERKRATKEGRRAERGQRGCLEADAQIDAPV